MGIGSLVLYGLQLQRLSILVDFQKAMNDLVVHETSIRAQMLAIAPHETHYFLKNSTVIENLMKYGRHFQGLVYSGAENGLGNKNDMFSALSKLEKAWEGNVKIKVDFGDKKAEISFTMATE